MLWNLVISKHVSHFLAFSDHFVCLHKNNLRLKLKTTSQQETQHMTP
jgi:hypothetical protein